MGATAYPYVDEWGERLEITFEVGYYETNGRLAVEAWCRSVDEDMGKGAWEPYDTVTVNLWEPIDGDDCAYLDMNNSPVLVRWMIEQGFVSLIPRTATSGFCEYPEGRFTTEFLRRCLRPGIYPPEEDHEEHRMSRKR